jgi:cathepsin F
MARRLILVAMMAAACMAVALDEHMELQFKGWMAEHEVNYQTKAEYARRLAVFAENMRRVASLNKQSKNLGNTDEYGINRFADMTESEFRHKILMPGASADEIFEGQRNFAPSPNVGNLPESFDWRDRGAVTQVRDQGSVGTCWAFATAQNMEGQWYLAGKVANVTELSPEQISECDNTNCGVFGGWPHLAVEYVVRAGGIATEADWPYCMLKSKCWPCMAEGYNKSMCGNHDDLYCKKNESCQPHPYTAQFRGWQQMSTNETELAAQLVSQGPLSVLLDATWLQFYSKGIHNPLLCSKTTLNHAVLLVGYGTEKGTDYWIVKNSWAAKWGEQGYFRIVRGTGKCGINASAITALV